MTSNHSLRLNGLSNDPESREDTGFGRNVQKRDMHFIIVILEPLEILIDVSSNIPKNLISSEIVIAQNLEVNLGLANRNFKICYSKILGQKVYPESAFRYIGKYLSQE